MFLTTAEVALAGVGTGGVLGWVGTWIGVKTTRNKDHHQRIWERAADLYEQVLVQAAAWSATRDRLMRTHRLSEPDREIPTLDNDENHRMMIRLDMFSHREVRDAFERYAAAHWQWAGCHRALQDAYDQNSEVMAGHMIGSELISTEEINFKHAERKTTAGIADEQDAEFRRAVHGVICRIPKHDRWFRRAPRALGRGIRNVQRYRRVTPDERQRRRQIRRR